METMGTLVVMLPHPEVRALPAIVARVKRVFDLGADIATIDQHLARDPRLAPLIAEVAGPEVKLIDTGEAVAKQVVRRLAGTPAPAGDTAPRARFWTTGDVQCQWFSGNDILESTFKPDSLKKIDDATGIATFGGRLG